MFTHMHWSTHRSILYPGLLILAILILLSGILTDSVRANGAILTAEFSAEPTVDCFGTIDVSLTVQGQSGEIAGPPVDVMFVLDESGSVSTDDFDAVKDVVTGLVGELPFEDGQYTAGVVTFATSATLIHDLTTESESLQGALVNHERQGGWTNLYQGLLLADERLDSAPASRPDATKVFVTITEGKWNTEDEFDPNTLSGLTEALLADIQDRKYWYLFGIGMENYDVDDLGLLASEPKDDFFYELTDTSGMLDVLLSLGASSSVPAAIDIEYSVSGGPDFELGDFDASHGSVELDASGDELLWTIDELFDGSATLTYELEHVGETEGQSALHTSALLSWSSDGEPDSISYAGESVEVTGCEDDPADPPAEPANLLAELIADAESSSIHHGLKQSRLSQLNNVQRSLDRGNERPACHQLNAFINGVNAQSGKHIPADLADDWIAQAQAIRDALNC